MPAYLLSQIESTEEVEEKRKQLRQEIEEYDGLGKRYINKVYKFMEAHEIWTLNDLNYDWRIVFANELSKDVKSEAYGYYLKAFDHLKRYSLRQQEHFCMEQNISKYPYENRLLFLPYHQVQSLVKRLERMPEREEWIWDFSIPASKLMKRQMYTCLNGILKKDGELLHVRLGFLHLFYQFCVENQIADIEMIRLEQMQMYREFLAKRGKTKDFGVLDMCRYVLFVQHKKIRWNAMIWYLERFQIAPERINPASPVISISFMEVTHDRNRELLQEYAKYGLGLTDLSIGVVRAEIVEVRTFLKELEVDVCEVTEANMKDYFNRLQKGKIRPVTFNKKLFAIKNFYDFLLIRKHIGKIPFRIEYYLNKTLPVHNNRSVPVEAVEEMLDNLYRFPEHLRMMFLHLWATGLRISEVCRLKGDAYYIQGGDTWIQVYQTKMKNYKRIPIPKALYQLMQVYLRKRGIKGNEHVFQNSNGGAYLSATFRIQMIRRCEQLGIQNGDYLFKAHDYRHGLATYLYDNEVSIQGIRDYLGHAYEEMTRQYIDYMPKRIDQANKEFFKKQESSLASCLRR